jgi:hypothetical protein
MVAVGLKLITKFHPALVFIPLKGPFMCRLCQLPTQVGDPVPDGLFVVLHQSRPGRSHPVIVTLEIRTTFKNTSEFCSLDFACRLQRLGTIEPGRE